MKAVNLIPADQRGGSARTASRSQGGAYFVLGILGGLALLAFVYGVARHQVSSRKAKVVALEAQVQRVQADASRLAPYSSFVSLREQREQAVSQLVNSRFDWAHAFHELGRVLPAHVSISSLTGTVGGTPGSGPSSSAPSGNAGSQSGAGAKSGSVSSSTPAGSVPTFTIAGCAKTQSTVAIVLDRLRLIDGVSTVTLQSSTKPSGGGGSVGSAHANCPKSYPVFSVQATFAPLPASSAVSPPAVSPSPSRESTSSKNQAKSAGGSQ
jgi:hypothetical protein